ncbi:MAG: ArsA family ATPase [Acidobacteria bacterium]|nr:ArsA family ATPase [Acidobacteriota bacterium]
MGKVHFFIGKGGVGKTTVSAAFAVRAARGQPRGRVLLLSSDPAHSLADVLQLPLRDRPRRVPLGARGRLDVWQINSEKLFADFLAQHKSAILDLIDQGTVFSREDIEPLLNTSLPGMAEMSALLAIRDALAAGKYSQVVVDTAPIGHTLRLFSLANEFLRFLDFLELAASRDQILAQHFGGRSHPPDNAHLGQLRQMVDEIREAIGQDRELVLVTTAEQFSLNESLRASSLLRRQSPPLEVTKIVLNRVVPVNGCIDCRRSAGAVVKAYKFLTRHFPRVPVQTGQDPGGPILGVRALAAFGAHVFAGRALKYDLPAPRTRAACLVKTSWPVLDRQLCLVLGKGGVGKTTTSAGLAFHARQKSKAGVEICSVDPAPSLDDVFDATIGAQAQPVFGDQKFRASELDAVRLFRDWIHGLQSKIEEATTSSVSRIHLDLYFERRLLSALFAITPPGVDEVLAVFRIFDLVKTRTTRIVIDMAPTGHALELLSMPERILHWSRLLLKTLARHRTLAFARDAAAKIAEMSVRARELTALLRDPERAEIDVVMLPEPLPDRETERLIAQIQAQRLPLRRILVNRVLVKSTTKCPRCTRRRQWQQATVASIDGRHGGVELLLVQNFPREIIGKSALQSFTKELWRIK